MSFKIHFNETGQQNIDIRRVRLSPTPSWQQFDKLLKTLFKKKYSHKHCLVQYIDEEGDFITITTQEEWLTALSIVKDQPLIKIFIKQQHSQSKKEEEEEKEEKELVNENVMHNNPSHSNFLEEIFQDLSGLISNDNKTLTITLPEWLLESFKTNNDEGSVEIEINTELMSHCLFERGLSFLNEEKEYQLAKYDFQFAYLLNPSNLQSLYLLSKAQTQLKQNDLANKCIQFAFEKGLSQTQLDEFQKTLDNVDTENTVDNTESISCSSLNRKEEQEQEIQDKEDKDGKQDAQQDAMKYFQCELQLLRDLGFSDTESNLAGLIATNGDVNMVADLCLFRG